MPWSDQSGPGGWKGGDNGGPWGKDPSGGQSNAELEEFLRRSQERFKGSFSGGFNPLVFLIIIGAAVILWLFQAFYTINPEEQAVELLFGKPKQEVSLQGLHFHFWPFERVERVVIAERQLNIGDSVRRNNQDNSPLMLSGDQNIISVEFSVLYRVSNALDYLFNVADPDKLVRSIAESAMREVVGRRPAQDVYRDNRVAIAEEVRIILQATLNQYGVGVVINTVSIEDAAPPREVADAFDEVQRAEQDEDRFIEEANQYSNQKLGAARGAAAQIREEAAAYKNRIVEEAKGEANRFLSVYAEYSKAPDVTRKRLFLETMERVLKDSEKVIVESGSGQGVVPYLPLPELNRRRQGGSQ